MTTVRFPNAYLVGAPKAASSALMNMLLQHPEIEGCAIKETNFHCRDLDMPGARTLEEYQEMCRVSSEAKVLIDGSILSLYSQEAAKSIYEMCPDAKILMVLRNPVEAMYSWHSQMVFTGNEPITDFEEALKAESERRQGRLIPAFGTTHRCPQLLFYSSIMNYVEQLPRFTTLFPAENIMILLQEDLKEGAVEQCRRVFRFLGVTDFCAVPDVVNVNKQRRFAGLHRFLKRWFASPVRALVPTRLRLRMILQMDRWNSVETKRERLSPETMAVLRENCLPQIRSLEQMIGRELGQWY
ncbi:MAG: sulfotransferase [Planctomyces sp.]|nr:sulfotransferase [Planctomyces sp.]